MNMDLFAQAIAAISGIRKVDRSTVKIRRKGEPPIDLTANIAHIRTKDGHRHIVVNLEESK